MATSKSMPRTVRLECFAPGMPWGQWQTVEDNPQPATALVEELVQLNQLAGGITAMGGLTSTRITLQMFEAGGNGPSLTAPKAGAAPRGRRPAGRKPASASRPRKKTARKKKARRPARRGAR